MGRGRRIPRPGDLWRRAGGDPPAADHPDLTQPGVPADFPQSGLRLPPGSIAGSLRIQPGPASDTLGIDPEDPAERMGAMSKLFQYAGIAASVVLIAFGIGATVIGIDGRDRVRDDLAREYIVGTPDSTI